MAQTYRVAAVPRKAWQACLAAFAYFESSVVTYRDSASLASASADTGTVPMEPCLGMEGLASASAGSSGSAASVGWLTLAGLETPAPIALGSD